MTDTGPEFCPWCHQPLAIVETIWEERGGYLVRRRVLRDYLDRNR